MSEEKKIEIASRLALCRERIARAAEGCGRDASEIYLVGASKMNDTATVRAAIDAGLSICGENRVQEMLQKSAEGAYEGAQLHFIGHLQKNKVKNVVGLASLIHSVDSIELMEQIDRAAAARGLVQDILLEVNAGGEASKSGFAPEAVAAAVDKAGSLEAVRVRGLMTVAPICENSEEIRPIFSLMRKLFIDNGAKKYDNVLMDFLSMGMSGDFETAIACGANMIRLGSAIFGPRNYT